MLAMFFKERRLRHRDTSGCLRNTFRASWGGGLRPSRGPHLGTKQHIGECVCLVTGWQERALTPRAVSTPCLCNAAVPRRRGSDESTSLAHSLLPPLIEEDCERRPRSVGSFHLRAKRRHDSTSQTRITLA